MAYADPITFDFYETDTVNNVWHQAALAGGETFEFNADGGLTLNTGTTNSAGWTLTANNMPCPISPNMIIDFTIKTLNTTNQNIQFGINSGGSFQVNFLRTDTGSVGNWQTKTVGFLGTQTLTTSVAGDTSSHLFRIQYQEEGLMNFFISNNVGDLALVSQHPFKETNAALGYVTFTCQTNVALAAKKMFVDRIKVIFP